MLAGNFHKAALSCQLTFYKWITKWLCTKSCMCNNLTTTYYKLYCISACCYQREEKIDSTVEKNVYLDGRYRDHALYIWLILTLQYLCAYMHAITAWRTCTYSAAYTHAIWLILQCFQFALLSPAPAHTHTPKGTPTNRVFAICIVVAKRNCRHCMDAPWYWFNYLDLLLFSDRKSVV